VLFGETLTEIALINFYSKGVKPMYKVRTILVLFLLSLMHAGVAHAQWVQTNGPYGGMINSLAVSGTNLFAGTYGGGVFLSTNNGTSWTATGLTDTDVCALAISSTNLFAGTLEDGVFLSTNNGTSWTAVNNGLTHLQLNSLAVNSNGAGGTSLFAGTCSGGVFLSTNDGTSWTPVNDSLTHLQVHALAVSPNRAGGSNLFAGTYGGGVFVSTNNGTNWTAVNNGLTNTSIRALAVSGTNLFAGTVGGGVFLSTNNGTNWTAVNTGLTNLHVPVLGVSPNGAGGRNLFAGIDGGGLFLSTNNGTSWTAVNNGLTKTNVSALAVSGSNLFAGTESGVFLSTNNGTSWTAVNTGLTNTSVFALAVSGTNLFAGTHGGGVWRRPISDIINAAKGVQSVLLLGAVVPSRSDEQAESRAIIAKAIQAMGGEAKLAEFKAATWKSKGTYRFKDTTTYFTSEWAMQGPKQYRKAKDYDENGQRFTTTLILNGDKGWFRNREMSLITFRDDQLTGLRQENYGHWIALRLDLTDTAFTLSPLGESRIDSREALGIKVTHRDLHDVKFELFFNNESGLLAKMVTKIKGSPPEERVFSDYKETGGIKYAAKLIWMTRYGNDLAVQEEERYDMQLHDKLDGSAFDKP